jgi:RNA exonuclease 1
MQQIGLSKEDTDVDVELKGLDLGDAVSRTITHITQIYESLPRCTALIVYSGTGDPREIRRLQAMQKQYRREYQTKNWDNLSVKWTDTEIQALSKACQDAVRLCNTSESRTPQEHGAVLISYEGTGQDSLP